MLRIDAVGKSYGSTPALDSVSLSVGPGEMAGFVGANGAGKTTTMRIAMGLVAADAGRVLWDGRPVTARERSGWGYMPEERGLYPKMRVVEQLSYFARLRGISAADAGARATALVDQLGMVGAPRDYVQALSLGNQQRVQLAAALVHDPYLLILDEPFSGLDPMGVDVLAQALAQRRAAGTGVLFSSHQLELVERLCDRIVIIRGGQVVADGTLTQLREAAGGPDWEVDVDADASWVPAGVQLFGRVGGRYLLRLDGVDEQHVLCAAQAAGRVTHFGRRNAPLAELYREAVAVAVAVAGTAGTADPPAPDGARP